MFRPTSQGENPRQHADYDKPRAENPLYAYVLPARAGRGRRDSDTLSELSAEARRLAEKYNAYELAIDPDITERDEDYLNLLKSAGFAINNTKYRPEYLQARYVYRLYLGGLDEESVFANFHSKTRYNIRLASKKGVNCRIGGREDLPAFHEIMKETAARDGFLARSLKYFEDMYDALAPENLRLYLAEFEGTPLAGAIAIYYGDKVWYLYGASSNRERKPHAELPYAVGNDTLGNRAWLRHI